MNKEEFIKEIKNKTKEELKSMIELAPQVQFVKISNVWHRIDYLPAPNRLWLDGVEVF